MTTAGLAAVASTLPGLRTPAPVRSGMFRPARSVARATSVQVRIPRPPP